MQEAGNAIKNKPAGQSREVESMTEQAAEQRQCGCKTRYMMCGEGRHKSEARLLTHACVCVEVM